MKPCLLRAPLLSPHGPGGLWHKADGALMLGASGHILAADDFETVRACHPGAPVRDLRPCWILPGLVDLHTHLPQYGSVARDGLELLPWLETHIFPAEARFSDPARAEQTARAFFQDLLAWGTSTAVVYASIHAQAAGIAFAQADRAGLRLVLGKMMMDRNAPPMLLEDTEQSLEQSEELCQRWHGHDRGRLRYAFSPRFAPCCSPELMRKTGILAQKYDAYIQTHVAESLGELAWVKELFPAASDATEVYHHAGLLGHRSLLGHGIHLEARERALIRETGAVLVHCPRANAFLRSGIMPLRRWMDEDLRLGLGTDVGAGPSLSLWAEMAAACQTSKLRSAVLEQGRERPLDPAEAFRLATLGGAEALELDDVIGSLEAGKEADFLVVDPRVAAPMGEVDADPLGVLSRLMYREDPRMIREVHIRGKACHVGTA